MKQFLLVIAFTFISLNVLQSQTVDGTYERRVGTILIDTLVLKPDGTFTYHNYQKFDKPNPDKNRYANGTWKMEKNILMLYSEVKVDSVIKPLNFNNSKARYIFKSPRDKSDKVVKTALKFYESEIFWIKGMELFKIE